MATSDSSGRSWQFPVLGLNRHWRLHDAAINPAKLSVSWQENRPGAFGQFRPVEVAILFA